MLFYGLPSFLQYFNLQTAVFDNGFAFTLKFFIRCSFNEKCGFISTFGVPSLFVVVLLPFVQIPEFTSMQQYPSLSLFSRSVNLLCDFLYILILSAFEYPEKKSAMQYNAKINILTNELIRIMRNISCHVTLEEKQSHIQYFM